MKQTLFDTLGKSGHIVTMTLVPYYDFTTFQSVKILVSPAMFFDSLRLFTHYNIPLSEIFSQQNQVEQINLTVCVAVRRVFINLDCPLGKVLAQCNQIEQINFAVAV